MKVSCLIEVLKTYPPDVEIHIPSEEVIGEFEPITGHWLDQVKQKMVLSSEV